MTTSLNRLGFSILCNLHCSDTNRVAVVILFWRVTRINDVIAASNLGTAMDRTNIERRKREKINKNIHNKIKIYIPSRWDARACYLPRGRIGATVKAIVVHTGLPVSSHACDPVWVTVSQSYPFNFVSLSQRCHYYAE